MSKHTWAVDPADTAAIAAANFPAPWALSKDADAIVDGNGVRILTINMGYGEADLDYWPKALAVMLAAPDMLAALRRLFHACGHLPIEATPESGEMAMAALDAVRAIKKATGEDP